jgi:hypothetical protein
MLELDIGKTYCYVMLDNNVVEYWEDGEGWHEKMYCAGYVWAAAVMEKSLVPVNDLLADEE